MSFCRTIALLICACVSTAQAQTYSKAGFPCVAELCIGDGLAELRQLKWEKLKDRDKSPDAWQMANVGASLKGSVKPLAVAAIANGKFDSDSLEALAQVTANCKDLAAATGFFSSKAGSRTQVTVGLLPAGEVQRWTVVHIRRFMDVPNQEAAKELVRQLDERYSSFDKPPQRVPRSRGSYEANASSGYMTYDLEYTSAEYNRFEKKNRLPTSCRSGLKAD